MNTTASNANELERLSELADARLGVAEEMGWFVGIAAASIAYQVFNWWVALLCIFPAYFFAVHPYRKASDKADDDLHRAEGTGPYQRRK